MFKDDIYYNSRFSAILYPYGKCNLNCTYCFIDKNPALSVIDKKLEDSFKDENYYLNFIEEFFNPEILSSLQFWGGEPTLGFYRLKNLLPKLIEKYKKLEKIIFSSNFTTPSFVDDVFIIFDILSQFSNRNFIVDLQMSYDGPGELTNICRGEKVAERVIENYEKLLKKIEENKDKFNNITVYIHNKETMSALTMRMLGQDDYNILNYWEDQASIRKKAEEINLKNVYYRSTLLTVAAPSPWTQEDGLYFADFCRRSKKIMENNKELSDYTCNFIPYYKPVRKIFQKDKINNHIDWRNLQFGYCSLCSAQYGFLPEDLICTCHSGFVDMVESYQSKDINKIEDEHTILSHFFKSPNNPLIFNKKEYKKANFLMEGILKNTKNITNSNATVIQQLAKVGQIDKKFSTEALAYSASNALHFLYPVCYRNNFNITGSIGTWSLGEFKLFLNGALELMIDEEF